MSHIIRSTPFHKPTPFDFPRAVHPLSPPDTEVDSLPPNNLGLRETGSSSTADASMFSAFTKVDPADARTPYRKPSSLSYLHNGSVRGDSRIALRSAMRWLIVVVPPPAVSREHGSALFLNSSERSSGSHGVLMPLLPSLSGQLSAIAREFCFPSTSGICVYLQMSEAGMQFTPRVSDESWSILWGNAFDDRVPLNTPAGLPIAGRVEFDLDLRKARWFDAWVTACRREVDSGISVPPSIGRHHQRDESRTTFTLDQPEDSLVDDVSVTIQQKVPAIRHIPRKLSLLERVDGGASARSASRPASRNAFSPPRGDSSRLTLPPVTQTPAEVELEFHVDESEPQTAIQRVEKKVQSWRASSTFATSPLVSITGQTALDPANMPNTLPLLDADAPDADADGVHVLNLDDFTWSISSAGPLSAELEPDSALFSDWDRVPSVHLAERLEGSVCLTPTTCTSFGPPDYDPYSPVSSLISRLPSPDIGARHIDSAPLTPVTATSWGAPSEWPESPALSFRAPSVDIAARHMHSRPVTPSTATSWGAPLEWPPSPATPFYVHTPDIGQMAFDEDDYTQNNRRPWNHVWPYVKDEEKTMPWKHVWPYQHVATRADNVRYPSSYLNPGYPWIELYPAVYPHFDLYPHKPVVQGAGKEVNTKLESKYPYFSIYSAIYPSFEIYPGHVVSSRETPAQISKPKPSIPSRLGSEYPWMNLYPAVYPHFDLYPRKPDVQGRSGKVNVKLEANYPNFCIYWAVYPAFDIYPGNLTLLQEPPASGISVKLVATYPSLEIYPPVYPYLVIYPNKIRSIAPTDSSILDRRQVVLVRLQRFYPHFDLYPAVYPASLNEICAPIAADNEGHIARAVDLNLPMKYPYFNIYAAIYPFFDLYPCVSAELRGPRQGRTSAVPSDRKVNPAFDLRPAVQTSPGGHLIAENKMTVALQPKYPQIELYPPVYPSLCIYPAIPSPEPEKMLSVVCSVRYSDIDIYPAVYPYFDIYRSGRATTPEYWREPRSIRQDARYPSFAIYPPIYPNFDIYNTGVASDMMPVSDKLSVRLGANYPALDIYPSVYPHFQLYPTVQPTIQPLRRQRKTHQELHRLIMSRSAAGTSSSSSISTSPASSLGLNVARRLLRHVQKIPSAISSPESPARARASPSIPDVPLDVSQSSSSSASVSPNSNHIGLPARPSEVRRTMSLGRASTSPGDVTRTVSRSRSLRRLVPVIETAERPGHAKSKSVHAGESSLLSDVANGDGSPTRRKLKRDSIVLEKTKLWGVGATKVDESYAAALDPSEIPPPPLPTRRSDSEVSRRVSKLDRSKFPFH